MAYVRERACCLSCEMRGRFVRGFGRQRVSRKVLLARRPAPRGQTQKPQIFPSFPGPAVSISVPLRDDDDHHHDPLSCVTPLSLSFILINAPARKRLQVKQTSESSKTTLPFRRGLRSILAG